MTTVRADEPPGAADGRLAGFRIVVVDDDQDTLDVECFILAKEGAHVECFQSVAQGLEAVERLRPALVISDLAMPVEDGIAFVRRLRVLDRREDQHLPVVALSAHASDYTRNEALRAGFDLFLRKPIDPRVLVDAISGILESRGRPETAG